MKKSRAREPPPPHCCNCVCKNRVLEFRPKKSNLAADRLTLLPGFVSKGVKTRSSSTSSDDDDSPPKLRRSWRLKKNQPVTVSGYFNKLVKNKEKEEEVELDDGFGRRVFKSLINFELRNSEFYQKGIQEEVKSIEGVLKGRRSMSNRKRAYNEDDKENYPMKCPYVPPSSWVFQTPPNRKLNYNHLKVDETAMKPAVIETRNDRKIVYEMNRKVNVDLTGFSQNQEIDIDKRYMVEVAPSFGEEPEENKVEPFELENHFLSLTCRPKKAVPTLPRFATLKRKRGDIFEPQPGCSTDTDYRPNEGFIETLNLNSFEESFTFTFTSGEGDQGTTGHLFDFEGNKKNSFNFRF